jgi:hypothetical protein
MFVNGRRGWFRPLFLLEFPSYFNGEAVHFVIIVFYIRAAWRDETSAGQFLVFFQSFKTITEMK